jgi:hypothetical protein
MKLVFLHYVSYLYCNSKLIAAFNSILIPPRIACSSHTVYSVLSYFKINAHIHGNTQKYNIIVE